MPTDKDRVTLYIDHQLHVDIKAVTDEIDMSLSALTRFMYVFVVSMWQLDKSFRYQIEGLRAAFPAGVSDQQRDSAEAEYRSRRDQVFSQWLSYLQGYIRGVGGSAVAMSDADREVLRQGIGVLARALEVSYGVADFLSGADHEMEGASPSDRPTQ